MMTTLLVLAVTEGHYLGPVGHTGLSALVILLPLALLTALPGCASQAWAGVHVAHVARSAARAFTHACMQGHGVRCTHALIVTPSDHRPLSGRGHGPSRQRGC